MIAQVTDYTMLVRKEQRYFGPEFDPRHILIVVPNWVGDVVMATAALRAIRQRYSRAHIVHLMRPYVADVLAGTHLSDEPVFLPEKSKSSTATQKSTGTLDLIQQLRRRRFDLCVLMTNSFRSALIARLSGIPRRLGYARDSRSWLLTNRLQPLRKNRRFVPVSALDYYNDLARTLGCEHVTDQLMLATLPDDETAVDERLGPLDPNRPLVVLNPGANYGSAKCWPAEKYASLSDELAARYNARVVASLGPKEIEIADRLRATVREPIDIFIDPPLGLGPLRALIRRCKLLITNDTGPRHFAAAFGVPVVSIFGSSDPAWTDTRYAKERIVKLDLDCQPCMERICPLKHHDCMKQLSVSHVMEAVDVFLSPCSSGTGRTASQSTDRPTDYSHEKTRAK